MFWDMPLLTLVKGAFGFAAGVLVGGALALVVIALLSKFMELLMTF